MIFESLEEEEAWNEHMAHLASMSAEEKRQYGRMLDAAEKGRETRAKKAQEDDKKKAKAVRFNKGRTGVSRVDLLK